MLVGAGTFELQVPLVEIHIVLHHVVLSLALLLLVSRISALVLRLLKFVAGDDRLCLERWVEAADLTSDVVAEAVGAV